MKDLHGKSDTEDEETFDDDLDWLIQSSEEEKKDNSHGDTIKEESKKESDQHHQLTRHEDSEKQLFEGDNLGENVTSDEDSDIDDDLTEEERILLRRNTNLNDADDDYDVLQRLARANKELAEEEPVEELRERRVEFKAELVDPIPARSGSSLSSHSDKDENAVTNEMNYLHLHHDGEADERHDDVTERKMEDLFENEKNLIVERGGKFDFVENDHMTGGAIPREERKFSNSQDNEITLPPISTRPKSAPTRTPPRHVPRRPESAVPITNHRSRMSIKTFAYSDETKKIIKEKATLKAKQEAEEHKKRKEEEMLAREEADDAWRAWVERKNDEIRNKKKQEKEETKKREDARKDRNEAEEAFQAWLKQKSTQCRKDRIMVQQQQTEHDEGWYLRERKDCDHAFRAWLRKKNEIARRRREEENRMRRKSVRELRRARKTKKLMDSLRQAQQLKYVDYYGYRI